MPGEIEIKVTTHRPLYPALSVPQQVYLLLELTPGPNAPVMGALPVNFCLVLDRSGSMGGEKLKQMKQAAHLVVDRLGPQDLALRSSFLTTGLTSFCHLVMRLTKVW